MFGNTNYASKYCLLYKTRFSKYGNDFFSTKECHPEDFRFEISYGGIYQSDIDCMIKIKNFDRLGESFF